MEKNNDLWLERAAYIEKLEADLAAAKAENEGLRNVNKLNEERLEAGNRLADVIFEQDEQLAARDLVIKQLREAVYWLKLKTDPKYGYQIAEKAIALQATTEALDAYVQRAKEEVRDKCAAICDRQHDIARSSTGAARADSCATEIKGMVL